MKTSNKILSIFLSLIVFFFLIFMIYAKANMVPYDGIYNGPEKIYQFENIKEVHTNAPLVVFAEISEKPYVLIKQPQEVIDEIRVKYSEGKLKVSVTDDYNFHNHNMIFIGMDSLRKLNLGGVTEFRFHDLIQVDSLDFQLEGMAELNAELEANYLNAKVSGKSKIKVEGNVHELDLDADDASIFTATALKVRKANVELKGFSNVRLGMLEQLSGTVPKTANLRYEGEPNISGLKINE